MNKSKLVARMCAFLFFCSFTQVAQAQVGINTNSPVATLHVLPSNANSASIAEGIIAPNLTLTQLAAKDNAYTTDQRGALVFVTDATGTTTVKTTNVSEAGYYHFDGTIWNRVGGSPWMVQATTNAASKNDQNIYQSGNVAIGGNNAINNSKLSVYGNTTIGTTAANADLTVNGTFHLVTPPLLTSSTTTAVFDDNGKLGYAYAPPATVLFAQSQNSQYIPLEYRVDYNTNYLPLVVQWDFADAVNGGDIVTNNFLDFNLSEYSFVFREKVQAEVSGYVNYTPRAANDALAAVNVIIQYAEVGSSTWIDFAAARVMFFDSQYTQSIVISPAVKTFNAGDRIRMVTKKAAGVGSDHGYGSNTNAGIVKPNGVTFTKGIKILYM